ncbi:MAG: hypothetical protein ACRDSR_27000 [Pseudonocardiaceae bacterium]
MPRPINAVHRGLDALSHPRLMVEGRSDDAQYDRYRAQSRVDSAHRTLGGILDEATSLREEVDAAA